VYRDIQGDIPITVVTKRSGVTLFLDNILDIINFSYINKNISYRHRKLFCLIYAIDNSVSKTNYCIYIGCISV